MNIDVIQATEQDLDFLLELRKTTMTEHFEQAGVRLNDAQHVERIRVNFGQCNVLMLQGSKIGMLKVVEAQKQIKIMQIQILPAYQGKGLGREVIEHCIQRAQDQGKLLTLTVLKDNPAQTLYQRLGFEFVGEDELEFHMQCRR